MSGETICFFAAFGAAIAVLAGCIAACVVPEIINRRSHRKLVAELKAMARDESQFPTPRKFKEVA